MLRNRLPHLAGMFLVLALPLGGLCGCASPSGRLADGLMGGVLRCPDPHIARDAVPACILILESGLSASPDDPQLLRAAAGLYGFYGSRLTEKEESALRLTQRALDYALRAAVVQIPGFEDTRRMDFEEFKAIVNRTPPSDVPTLFSLGSAWLEWVRVRGDELDAIADLPRIEVVLERVVELEPTYSDGMAHLYLALLAAMLPAERNVIEAHFRHAIEMAEGRNLMPAVLYALWLRDVGDLQRCKQRLRDIVAGGPPDAPAYALVNQLALEKSREALALLNAGDG